MSLPVENNETPKEQEIQANVQQAANVHNSDIPEETPKDLDWRKFKEKRNQERKQAELIAQENAKIKEAMALKEKEAEALKNALDSLVNRPATTVYDRAEETEEDIIDRRVQEALDKRLAKQRQEEQEREQREFPNRLKQTYSDFDSVCSQDNFDYLEFHHPEIVEAIKRLPDNYEKGSLIYKTVKKYVPNQAEAKKDIAKVTRNNAKPQSMSVGGVTQTGDSAPLYLSEERKLANQRRMQRIMRGIS